MKSLDEANAGRLLANFPSGLLVVEDPSAEPAVNAVGREMLRPATADEPLAASCCEAICAHVDDSVFAPNCLTSYALESMAATPELRVELEDGRSIWVTAGPMELDGGGQTVVFQLRPAIAGERRRRTDRPDGVGPLLRVRALGRTRIRSSEGPVEQDWLDQRPAQLLKYLVCHRDRTPRTEEIAEALWADGEVGSEKSVRSLVHALRAKLEPGRNPRAESAFVASRRGGYSLQSENVWIDVDEFEQSVGSGLQALLERRPKVADRRLRRGLALYGGEFLDEERYAEWALPERERLRELLARALTALVEVNCASGDLSAAAEFSRQLADLEPYDSVAQRQHIEVCLMRGRRTEAMRRYMSFKRRMLRDFDAKPDFELNSIRPRPNGDVQAWMPASAAVPGRRSAE